MRFVTIVAACTACAILTLGVIGQTAVGTAAGAQTVERQIVERMVPPLDMMKDARRLPAETVHNGV